MKIGRAIKPYIPQRLHPHLRRFMQAVLNRNPNPNLYEERIRTELENYSGTDNVQDLPPIMQYWFNTHLVPVLQTFGFGNSIEMFRTYISQVCREHPEETCVVLSVGSGNSASEINIAQWLMEQGIRNFRFECLDLNSEVLDRGRRAAREKGCADRFNFGTFDVNSWTPERPYHVIVAFQCLHHFVELELLFDKIHGALRSDGFFLTDDMIGRNGHQRWPEALPIVEAFWSELPISYRYNHGLKRIEERFLNHDCSTAGFEGIRAQDILPLLVQRFHFDFFFGFGNVVDIFVDRSFGPNFDPEKPWDREFIDRVQAADVQEIESGRLKPTHVYAAMTKRSSTNPKFYKHLSAEFSVRRPNP